MKLTPSMCVVGDAIYYENEDADCMYFLKRGSADVRKGGRLLSTLREGDAFGEVALLSPRSVRSADVVCVTDCMLLMLTREDFNMVLMHFPQVGSPWALHVVTARSGRACLLAYSCRALPCTSWFRLMTATYLPCCSLGGHACRRCANGCSI